MCLQPAKILIRPCVFIEGRPPASRGHGRGGGEGAGAGAEGAGGAGGGAEAASRAARRPRGGAGVAGRRGPRAALPRHAPPPRAAPQLTLLLLLVTWKRIWIGDQLPVTVKTSPHRRHIATLTLPKIFHSAELVNKCLDYQRRSKMS